MAERYKGERPTKVETRKAVEENLKFELGEIDQKLMNRLEDELEIDEHAIDEELQEQAQHFHEVSKHLNLLTSRRDAAKQYLKELESRVYLIIKDKARAEEEKLSEKELEHRCNIHPDIVRQTEIYFRLSYAVGQFMSLKDSFIQRNYMLKEMSQLYIVNYYQSESVSYSGRDVSSIKDVDSKRARAAMREKREKEDHRERR